MGRREARVPGGRDGRWPVQAADPVVGPEVTRCVFEPLRLTALQLGGKRARVGCEAQEQDQIFLLVIRATVDTCCPRLEEDGAKQGGARKREGRVALDGDLDRFGPPECLGTARNLDRLLLSERSRRGPQPIGTEDVDYLAVDLETVAKSQSGRGRLDQLSAQALDRLADLLGDTWPRPRIAEQIDIAGGAGVGRMLIGVQLNHQPTDQTPALRPEMLCQLRDSPPRVSSRHRPLGGSRSVRWSRRLLQCPFDLGHCLSAGPARARIGFFGEIDRDGGERSKSSREVPGRVGDDAQEDVSLEAFRRFEGVLPCDGRKVLCSYVAIHLSSCD
jgi:hypothetical protein